jgi:hypothetical protein
MNVCWGIFVWLKVNSCGPFFITNFKLLKDMGSQNNVDLEVMWVILLWKGFQNLMEAVVCIRLMN